MGFLKNTFCYFQIQSIYNSSLIKQIKTFHSKFGIIQTVNARLSKSLSSIEEINNDKSVDYILLDSAQKGGTGNVVPIENMIENIKKSEKVVFVAGGIDYLNVGEILSGLNQYSSNLKIDCESSSSIFASRNEYVPPSDEIVSVSLLKSSILIS